MSPAARHWAKRTTVGSSTLKNVLKELCDYEQGNGEVWPSVRTIVESTELDRKTVLKALDELQKRGFIVDTGKRAGRTNQVPVYRLVGFESDVEWAHMKSASRTGAKSPKNGTVPDNANSAENGTVQPVESQAENAGTGQPNSPESGTVPKTGPVPNLEGNSPVFPREQSQKRDTELLRNRKETPDARASAQARARPGPETNSEPVDQALRASQLRGHWRNVVLNSFLTDIWLAFDDLRRQPFNALPARLRDLVSDYALPIADQAARLEIEEGQRSKALEDRVADSCRRDAAHVVSNYRSARAA